PTRSTWRSLPSSAPARGRGFAPGGKNRRKNRGPSLAPGGQLRPTAARPGFAADSEVWTARRATRASRGAVVRAGPGAPRTLRVASVASGSPAALDGNVCRIWSGRYVGDARRTALQVVDRPLHGRLTGRRGTAAPPCAQRRRDHCLPPPGLHPQSFVHGAPLSKSCACIQGPRPRQVFAAARPSVATFRE